MSKLEVDTIDTKTGTNSLTIKQNDTAAITIDTSQNVGIGTSSPSRKLHVHDSASPYIKLTNSNTGTTTNDGFDIFINSTGHATLLQRENLNMNFYTNDTERMRIDSSGNVLVGKTSTSSAVAGTTLWSGGYLNSTVASDYVARFNRNTTDGDIIQIYKDNSSVGSIGVIVDHIVIADGDTGLKFDNGFDAIVPASTTANRDNAIDLGANTVRFDDIYATNGTIQTSDQNEKQSIQSLSASEIAVAKRISKLFKTFKFNSAVEEKGDSARTHTGIIAQDVQQAFADEGLDASNYALFISSTWWEKEIPVDAVAPQEAVYETQTDEEGNEIQVLVQEAVEGKDAYTYIDTKEEATEGYTERTRLGIRYPELLSFVSSAFEQRLTNIETRLTALET